MSIRPSKTKLAAKARELLTVGISRRQIIEVYYGETRRRGKGNKRR